MPENIFIVPSYLNDFLIGYNILSSIFSFNSLKILLHVFLHSVLLMKKILMSI